MGAALELGLKITGRRDKQCLTIPVDKANTFILKKDIGTFVSEEDRLELVLFLYSIYLLQNQESLDLFLPIKDDQSICANNYTCPNYT